MLDPNRTNLKFCEQYDKENKASSNYQVLPVKVDFGMTELTENIHGLQQEDDGQKINVFAIAKMIMELIETFPGDIEKLKFVIELI